MARKSARLTKRRLLSPDSTEEETLPVSPSEQLLDDLPVDHGVSGSKSGGGEADILEEPAPTRKGRRSKIAKTQQNENTIKESSPPEAPVELESAKVEISAPIFAEKEDDITNKESLPSHSPVVSVEPNDTEMKDASRQESEKEESEVKEDEASSDDEYDATPYCICRQPAGGKFMLQCDNCSEWFHGRCVKMTKEKARNIPQWICPNCTPAADTVEQEEVITETDRQTKSSPILQRSSSNDDSISNDRKRRKSHDIRRSSIHSSSGKLEGQMRLRVIENFERVLESALDTLEKNKSKADEERSKSSDPTAKLSQEHKQHQFRLSRIPRSLDIPQLALDIEMEMHKLLRGNAYKEKFRTLHFNLKDLNNAFNVLSGQIPPEKLVTMTAEDLANENLKAMKEQAAEQSLRESVLTEEMASVILKKTKLEGKMAESSPRKTETFEPVNTAVETIIGKSGLEPPPISTVEILTSPILSSNSIESSADIITQGPLSIDESVKVSEEILQANTGSLDALLAKVGSAKVVNVKPVDHTFTSEPQENTVMAEPSDTEAQPADLTDVEEESLDDAPFLKQLPVVWKGKVHMDGVSSFRGTVKFAGGASIDDREWKELISPILEIAGRISTSSVHQYLDEQVSVDSRLVTVLAVQLESKDDRVGYQQIWDYFVSRNRYAVVKNIMARVKDFYLIPVKKEDALPDFMSCLRGRHSIPDYDREYDILLGVIVHVNKRLISAPPSQSATQSQNQSRRMSTDQMKHQPAPAPAGDLDHALSLLGSIVPALVPQQPPPVAAQAPVQGYGQAWPSQQHGYPSGGMPMGYTGGMAPQSQPVMGGYTQQGPPHIAGAPGYAQHYGHPGQPQFQQPQGYQHQPQGYQQQIPLDQKTYDREQRAAGRGYQSRRQDPRQQQPARGYQGGKGDERRDSSTYRPRY